MMRKMIIKVKVGCNFITTLKFDLVETTPDKVKYWLDYFDENNLSYEITYRKEF